MMNLQPMTPQKSQSSSIVPNLNSGPEMKTTPGETESSKDPTKTTELVTLTPVEEEVSKPKSTGKYPKVDSSQVSKPPTSASVPRTNPLKPFKSGRTLEKAHPAKMIETPVVNNSPLSTSKSSPTSVKNIPGRSIPINASVKSQSKSDKNLLKPADIQKFVNQMNQSQKLNSKAKTLTNRIETSTEGVIDSASDEDLEVSYSKIFK